uniref:Alanine-rich protein n=1 Tax=Streptomyces sp. NBC_01401 TaxID=2903854 RepID=A0AAU3H3D9_9ACTN
MKASAFLYPWDVVGDPDAPARLAGLGVQQVTLAAAYHSTRALTPRHPGHRIVTAEHAAVLYPPDAARWAGREPRPYTQTWVTGDDPYAEAADALAAAGLQVHSWVVLAHNSRLGAERPDTSVVNAYGDRYPWAPCIAQPAVHAYLVDLAAEAAVRPGTAGTELESCGWYGFAHLHAHDKTSGVALGDAAQYLMSLCFCADCRAGYATVGLDAEQLRTAVRRALEPVFAGSGSGEQGWAAVEKLLGAGLADATLRWRVQVARGLQEAAVAAVRAAAAPDFQVLLHADPASYRTGANVGTDPAHILSTADGVVLPCTGGEQARDAVLGPFAGLSGVLAANFNVVSGMGGSPTTLAQDAAHAASLGANELRLYHAGLASGPDLSAVTDALSAVRGG